MGSQVIAKCKCGVDKSILIGVGFLNFETTYYFPCLCERCHDVVQVNLRARRKQCPKCRTTKVIPYDDPQLSEDPGSHALGESNLQGFFGRDVLTDRKYRCPKCGKMTLSFTETDMCWD